MIGYTWRPVLMVEEESGENPQKEPPTHEKLLASFLTYPHWLNLRHSSKMQETNEDLQKEPGETGSKKRLPCPYNDTNWLSRLSFWWLNSLFKLGFTRQLKVDDLYDVRQPQDESKHLADKLEKFWIVERLKKRPSLFRAVLLAFRKECLLPGVFLIFSETIRVLQPYLVGEVISYFSVDSQMSRQDVYIYAIALGVLGLIQLCIMPLYFYSMHCVAMQMKAAVGAIIYRKILKMSSYSLHKTSTGQIVNMLSTDVNKFDYATETFHFIWIAPIEIAIVLYLIYRRVGIAALFTLAVILSLVPLQFLLGYFFGKLRTRIGGKKDKRTLLMNEVIAGMRVIKMYCWEKPFSHLITQLRRQELRQVWNASMLKSLSSSLFLSSGRLLALVVFAAAWKMGLPLTAKTVFSSIGWIEILRISVFLFLFYAIEDNTQLAASLKRIQRVLLLDDMHTVDETRNKEDIGPVRISESDSNIAVEINNMTAFWDSHLQNNKPVDSKQNEEAGIALMQLGEDSCVTFGLKSISLQVIKGELLAVIGPVGAGKSSLLMSLLGELPPLEGGITLNGCLGYVSQQPWVFSGTLRENILFGSPYDKTKYDQIVHCCALIKDIEQFRYGDLTLVGERGLCLSGGQKARVTLARCLYQGADILLLDDPLSAVDTEVGRHLFSRCICDYLKDKTRILVTHQLQYLKKADRILILKEGVIGDIGTFDELSARGTEFYELLEDPDHKEQGLHDSDVKEDLTDSDGQIKAEESEQMAEEDQSEGRVGVSIYRQYLASCSGFITVPVILLIGFTVHAMGYPEMETDHEQETSHDEHEDILSNKPALMQSWIRHTRAEFHELKTFSGLASSSTASNCENCSTIPGPINTSNLVSLTFPMTVMPNMTMPTQTGSLHSSEESGFLSDYYMTLYTVLSTSYLGLVFILSALFYTFATLASRRLHDKMFWIVLGAKSRFFDSNPVGRILNRFSRDIGFIDEILPRIFFVVVELTIRLTGLILTTCIINPWLLIPVLIMTVFIVMLRYYAMHTLRETKRIEAIARSPMYSHVSDTLVGIHTIRALGKRDQFIQEFDTLQNIHTSAWFIFLSSYRWFSLRSLFAVYIYFNIVICISIIVKHGFGLTSGLLGLSINYCLIIADPFEFLVRMTAELENAMTSVERILSYNNLEQEAAKDSPHPPQPDWPQLGEITLSNLSLSYTSDGPQVLKNISCSIKSKEKIGIVGRTGAGKSSLMAAILRMAEPSGGLVIDNINVLKIGLHELRKKISVIPQDPVLFSGTLRRNLDPFDEYSDDQLWKVLSQVQLSDKVSSSQGGLSMEVSEGGQNFSVGQRQLLCLARAMLRFNKILILDEATANVDHTTDELIQQTVRDHFRHCTVLTIAHRLRTVMDSDRLMILEQGQLVEMDRPDVLLQNPKGYFYKLVQQTGNLEVQKLQALARKERNKIEDAEDNRQQPNSVTEEHNGDDENSINVRIVS